MVSSALFKIILTVPYRSAKKWPGLQSSKLANKLYLFFLHPSLLLQLNFLVWVSLPLDFCMDLIYLLLEIKIKRIYKNDYNEKDTLQ